MKHTLTFINFALLLMTAACGPMKSNPLEDFQRPFVAEGTPQDPQTHIIVEDQLVDELVAQGEMFSVEHATNINFTEGQSNEYEIKVKLLKSKAKFDVEISNLPDGASRPTVTKDFNQASFKISFSPRAGFIPSTQTELLGKIKLKFKNFQFDSSVPAQEKTDMQTVLGAISTTREIDYTVRRNQASPTLAVKGLKNGEKRLQNEKFPFTVEVKIPGASADLPPDLLIGYDAGNSRTAKGLETDGTQFVKSNPAQPNAKLNGETWTFFYVFDTTGNLEQQRDKDLNVVADAKELLVNLTFQAIARHGSSSDVEVLRFGIEYKQESTLADVPAGMTLNSGGR